MRGMLGRLFTRRAQGDGELNYARANMSGVNQSTEPPIVTGGSEREASACPRLRTAARPLPRDEFAPEKAVPVAHRSRPFLLDDER